MSGNQQTAQTSNLYPVPAAFAQSAHIGSREAYDKLCQEAQQDHTAYWGRLAKEFLSWHKPFGKVLDESQAPFYKWFEDGLLNASYNCLDRQIEAGLGDKTAIIFEADDGKVSQFTYKDLLARVSRLANALKAQGVK